MTGRLEKGTKSLRTRTLRVYYIRFVPYNAAQEKGRKAMFIIRYWSPNGDSMGTISAPAEAARAWLESKIDANWSSRAHRAELLDGREVVAVYECNEAGEMIQTADRNGDTKMADEAKEVATEEAAPAKGPNKGEQVFELMQQEGGISVDEIAEKMGMSDKAVRSWISDLRRRGNTIERTKVDAEGGKAVSVYKART